MAVNTTKNAHPQPQVRFLFTLDELALIQYAHKHKFVVDHIGALVIINEKIYVCH